MSGFSGGVSVAASFIGFSAHKNGTDQTGVADATFTQITFGTELYDVGGYFASNAWTPPAGKVGIQLSFTADATMGVGSVIVATIYKNGAAYRQSGVGSFANAGGSPVAIEDIANGTDVYTAYAFVDTTSGTATIRGAALSTFFSGHWIAP